VSAADTSLLAGVSPDRLRVTRMKRSRPLLRLVRDVGPASPYELQAIHDEAIWRRDALMMAFRTGGLRSLNEPANQERISRLSEAQRDELRERMKRWASA
jgi:hypothetical protein